MNFLANKIINIFFQYDYNHRDINLFKAGINITLRYFIFGLTIFVISFLLNDIVYIFSFDLFLIILRRKLGGAHAYNAYTCFLVSVITFAFIPYYVNKWTINNYLIYFIASMDLLILYFIPPCKANNRKYPSSFYNKMNFQKKLIILIYFILLILSIKINSILARIICFSTLINIVSIFLANIKKEKETINENIFKFFRVSNKQNCNFKH